MRECGVPSHTPPKGSHYASVMRYAQNAGKTLPFGIPNYAKINTIHTKQRFLR